MTFLKQNKYHFLAGLVILLLFLLSVHLRRDNLALPLSRHHEWITAHTLITCQVWQENGGPSAYHFSPVYTFPGEGNNGRTMLGGVVDEKGDVYYVSYPPFAFLFAYYATQVLGGPDVDSIRQLNLAIHLLCSIFIYLLAVTLASTDKKHQFSIAGICAAFLYLFSAGNLWIHGNLYFADMMVQLFVIAGLYFSVRFFKKEYLNERVQLSILFFVFFLAAYTEWLGLFLAFFTGIGFLLAWLMAREKRFIKAFITVGTAAALALVLTVWQYSSIAGWDNLKKVSVAKYEERSGHESAELSPNKFNLENDAALNFLVDKVDEGYKMAENFVGIFLVLFLLVALFRRMRRNMVAPQWHSVTFCVFALAVLTHYYLFFNFNALHDFSSLKTGFLMILLVLLFISLTESMFSITFRRMLLLLVVALAVDKGLESVEKYNAVNPTSAVDWNRIRTAEMIRLHSRPDVAVFANIYTNPELVYYSGHAVFPIHDTADLKVFTTFFENNKGQYYHHSGTELEYILEFERRGDGIVYKNKINMAGSSGGSERHFQK